MSPATLEKPRVVQGKLELQISSDAPEDWNEFVQRSTGCIFHETVWADILRDGFGAKYTYCYLREKGEIKIGFNAIIFDFKVFRLLFSTITYGGFIGDLSYLGEFRARYEPALKARGIHLLRITRIYQYPYPDLEGYSITKAAQHVLDLTGKTKEILWQGYKKNIRRDVRRARKLGVTIRRAQGEADVDRYVDLYKQTIKRNQGICYYHPQVYRLIYRRLVCSGRASMLIAEKDGKFIAGTLCAFSGNTSFLLGNVSDPKYLKLCPNDLVMHESIEEAIDRGLSSFDFMTSDLSDKPLMWFKAKWGAEQHEFNIFESSLVSWRCWLWEKAWNMTKGPLGSKLVEWFSGGKDAK